MWKFLFDAAAAGLTCGREGVRTKNRAGTRSKGVRSAIRAARIEIRPAPADLLGAPTTTTGNVFHVIGGEARVSWGRLQVQVSSPLVGLKYCLFLLGDFFSLDLSSCSNIGLTIL